MASSKVNTSDDTVGARSVRGRTYIRGESVTKRCAGQRRTSACDVPRAVRDEPGTIRHRSTARVGAACGRSLLHARQAWLLQRHEILPRVERVHGAVRAEWRSEDPGRI